MYLWLVLLLLLGCVGQSQACIGGLDTRVKVGTAADSYNDYRAFSAFLNINLTGGEGLASCSASLVRGLMPSPWVTFLTAGHCLLLPDRYPYAIESIAIEINGVSSDRDDWREKNCVGLWSKRWTACAAADCDQNGQPANYASGDYGIIGCDTSYVGPFQPLLETGFGLLSNVAPTAEVFTLGYPRPQPDGGAADGMWRAPDDDDFIDMDALFATWIDVTSIPLTRGQSGSPIVWYDEANEDYLVVGMMSGDSLDDSGNCLNAASRLHPTTLVELTDLAVSIYGTAVAGADPHPQFGLGFNSGTTPVQYKYWLSAAVTSYPSQQCSLNPNTQYSSGGPHANADLTALWAVAVAYIPSSLTTTDPPPATQKFVYSMADSSIHSSGYPTYSVFLSADPTANSACVPGSPSKNGCGAVTCAFFVPDNSVLPTAPVPDPLLYNYPLVLSTIPGTSTVVVSVRSNSGAPNYPYYVRIGGTAGAATVNLQVLGGQPNVQVQLYQDNFKAALWNFV